MKRSEFIGYADAHHDSYLGNTDVLAQINQVDSTLIVGYSGAGKDTLRRGTGLHVVVSDTIRDPRQNNGEWEIDGVDYWFRGDELDAIHTELEAGGYVQYGMGPARNSFYGSRAVAYPTEGPALLDVVAPQIPIMRRLPFRSIEAVFVTAPSYEVWMGRWAARGFGDEADTQGRMSEARSTIESALDTEGIIFIANDYLTLATEALHRFATVREIDPGQHRQGRKAAEDILRNLREAV